ncbi:MAG: DUF3006 domain-containing protein [Oscillospiraceae bacterium]|jgi:hypothetical protein|nr:DUF3006 domain-containing protein [Oscillospiraceae bacterium]
MGERVVVERIEGDWVVLETDAGMVNLPLTALPQGTRAGAVLQRTGDIYTPDPAEEARRRAHNLALQDELFSMPE